MSTIIPNLTDGIDTVRNDTGEVPALKSLPSFVSLLTLMRKLCITSLCVLKDVEQYPGFYPGHHTPARTHVHH